MILTGDGLETVDGRVAVGGRGNQPDNRNAGIIAQNLDRELRRGDCGLRGHIHLVNHAGSIDDGACGA